MYAQEQDRKEIKKEREDFIAFMPYIDASKLIVIDESGFCLNMLKTHGRCLKNERLKMPAPLYGKSISVIGAISLNKIIDIGMFEGSTNQYCVETFIKYCLLPSIKPGNILLIDNAPVHNIDKINQELLKPLGAIALPLPRYSPDLSPIEMCWSKLKNIIRTLCPRSMSELFVSLCTAINEINSGDLNGWYEHCGWSWAA